MKPALQDDGRFVDEDEEWLSLTPEQRLEESGKLWELYLAMGGSLDPESDTQSPFFDRKEESSRAAHGRSGMRVVRRGGV